MRPVAGRRPGTGAGVGLDRGPRGQHELSLPDRRGQPCRDQLRIRPDFTTLPEAPAVFSEPPSAVSRNSATLNGTVNPNGVSLISCEFEFASLEHYVPCSSLPGPGLSPVSVSAPVSALQAGATFRYRVIAANAGGTSYGTIQEFTTPRAAPSGTPPG